MNRSRLKSMLEIDTPLYAATARPYGYKLPALHVFPCFVNLNHKLRIVTFHILLSIS